ncbi:MAG: UDP-3-O-(3-hydroxymyristoyl)glucosamine N-acyltransferase [Kiritimatiellia bacterium]
MLSLTVQEIAGRLQAKFDGDGDAAITGVAGIRYADRGDISFVSQERYAADVAKTKASAVIVSNDWSKPSEQTLIRVAQPEKAFVEVAKWFAPPAVSYAPGIHATAVISPGAKLGTDVHIGPYCVIEDGVIVGDRTVLMGHNFIAQGASIDEDGLVYPLASLREYVRVGKRAILHNGVVIGSDGFGYDADKNGVRTKVPQIGIVEVGDDVEIGANSTIDRARFGKTTIGNGVKIDNLVMVAHNCFIGDHSVLVAQTGIAGSTIVGHHTIFAGQSGSVGHLEIGPGSLVLTRAGVTRSFPAKSMLSGYPAIPHKEFGEQVANISRLPKLKERIAELEKKIAELESRL